MFPVTEPPSVGVGWGGEGRCFVSAGEASGAGAGRFPGRLTISDQTQLLDPLIGRVLKMTASGRTEIQQDRDLGWLWLVRSLIGELKVLKF